MNIVITSTIALSSISGIIGPTQKPACNNELLIIEEAPIVYLSDLYEDLDSWVINISEYMILNFENINYTLRKEVKVPGQRFKPMRIARRARDGL